MKDFYAFYDRILNAELKPALGCTEPIAIAFAAASARSYLNHMPERMSVRCSGNIIKNVKGVTVPNSSGMKGIETAALLGAVGGDASLALEVLSTVTDDDRKSVSELLKKGICTVELAEGVAGLFIEVTAIFGKDSVSVTIENHHNEIARVRKNGEILFSAKKGNKESGDDEESLKAYLSVDGIIDYALNAPLKNVRSSLKAQWKYNEQIAEEGLSSSYGASIGRMLLKNYDKRDVRIRARAKAAAASDARMSGCPLPVVINSGSGNQGLTVSLPVIEYGLDMGKSEDEILRALALSNLIAIHQKKYIGPLSAYCGAVSAAAGASAAIAFLHTHDEREISDAITNTLASVGGIVCDGAKASCAAKISSALEAAIMGFELADEQKSSFKGGDGLVKDDIENTIKTFGKVGKDGMRETDIEILHLMLDA